MRDLFPLVADDREEFERELVLREDAALREPFFCGRALRVDSPLTNRTPDLRDEPPDPLDPFDAIYCGLIHLSLN